MSFLRFKDVKISLYIIVLIVRGCFERMHGLNKLFLHLMRALCFCIIMIGCLVFFSCILLVRNHMISSAIWNKQALVNFFKDHKQSLKKFTRAYLFQIALEIM